MRREYIHNNLIRLSTKNRLLQVDMSQERCSEEKGTFQQAYKSIE